MTRRRALWLLGVVMLALFAVLAALDGRMQDAGGHGIVAFELAFPAARRRRSSPLGRRRARRGARCRCGSTSSTWSRTGCSCGSRSARSATRCAARGWRGLARARGGDLAAAARSAPPATRSRTCSCCSCSAGTAVGRRRRSRAASRRSSSRASRSRSSTCSAASSRSALRRAAAPRRDDGDASEIFAPGLLDGQVALVTGGGTGLGKAAARELARCGASVVLAGRRAEVLEAAAAEIGPAASAVVGDIREDDGAAAIVDAGAGAPRPPRRARQQRRRAVLRAGGGDRAEGLAGGASGSTSAAPTRMTELVVERAMRPAGGGTILNVTLSPHHGLPGMTHSSAARAAVEGLTRAWARAVGGGRDRGRRARRRPLRDGGARQVPGRRARRRRAHGPAAAARAADRARLAGRAARLAARPRASAARS